MNEQRPARRPRTTGGGGRSGWRSNDVLPCAMCHVRPARPAQVLLPARAAGTARLPRRTRPAVQPLCAPCWREAAAGVGPDADAAGFRVPARRRRPSDELRSLDELYDRRPGSLSRPMHTQVLARRARRARSGEGGSDGTGYFAADDPRLVVVEVLHQA